MSALPQEASRPDLEAVRGLARQLRVDSIRAVAAAGSGHPTSSLSAADLMAVLFARHLHYDWGRPGRADNDHLIFSKGHASPLLYSLYKAVGVISDQELVDTYRRAGSPLQGHPTPVLPGSTWQPARSGRACRTASASPWPASDSTSSTTASGCCAATASWRRAPSGRRLDKASHYGLDNLTAIVDVNRLGQSGPTELGWDLDAYRRRVESFGCRAIEIDGHDPGQIDDALTLAERSELPTVILARTIKGKGVPEVENANGWHGKPIPKDAAEAAVRALGGITHRTVATPTRQAAAGGRHHRGAPRGDAAAVRDRHEGRDQSGLRRYTPRPRRSP